MADPYAEATRLSIACVIHSLSGGGAERVMAGLCSRLAGGGHDVTLITFDDGTEDRHELDPQVDRVFLDLHGSAKTLLGRMRQTRRRQSALASAIREIAPDTVLSFCDRTNLDVLMGIRPDSPPIVVCERSDPSQQSLGKIRDFLRRRTYPNATSVVALTESSAEFLRQFCSRVIVIPSAVQAPPLLSDRQHADKSRLVVAAGRLEPEKGFDRLLQAFAIATEKRPDWRLAIFGEGSQRQPLEQKARRLGLADQVEMPGWVRPLADRLAGATFFCLSSHYEGFPSVLLESMSMGVPSISVDCESGPRAIIDHGRNGLLVEPSVTGLAEGVVRMMDAPEERERMGQAGRDVVQRFSWEAMTRRFESVLYQSCRPDIASDDEEV